MANYNFIDRTGQVFGRLIVTSRAPNIKGRTFWSCLCECGEVTSVRGEHLKNGATTSCGCYSIESHRKHDMSATTEYKCWQAMKARCLTKTTKQYKDYGGRGITVCSEWIGSFEAFYTDMGECAKGLTIDRIDNNKGYSPNNCRWATRHDQSRNKRNSKLYTINGITKCLKDWCAEYGKSYSTIRHRLARGISLIDALNS